MAESARVKVLVERYRLHIHNAQKHAESALRLIRKHPTGNLDQVVQELNESLSNVHAAIDIIAHGQSVEREQSGQADP